MEASAPENEAWLRSTPNQWQSKESFKKELDVIGPKDEKLDLIRKEGTLTIIFHVSFSRRCCRSGPFSERPAKSPTSPKN